MSADDLSDVDRRILSLFGAPSAATILDRSTIRSRVKRQANGAYSKREVGRALKRLAKRGRLQKTGHDYSLPPAQDDSPSSHSGESSSDDASADPVVPIAQRMRQQSSAVKLGAQNDPVAAEESKTDIDDEIRRLEAELAADGDSSEDDDSDVDSHGDDDDVPRDKTISFGADSVHEYAPEIKSEREGRPSPGGAEAGPARGVICLSSVADERIAPLPPSALPQSARRKLKIDSADGGAAGPPKSKKRRRSDDEPGDGGRCHPVSEGLRSAVQELLADYVPASQLDRPAFYCRVCQHQSSSKEDFDAHRSTQLHGAAVREEKKKTYCKLCRKQLTSLVQMEEHLKSRPHRAKMDAVKARQRGAGRGGAPRGRGRGGNSNSRGRQWC